MSPEKMSHRIKYAISWVVVKEVQNNVGWLSVEWVYHRTLQLLKTLTWDSISVLSQVNPTRSSVWLRWLHVPGKLYYKHLSTLALLTYWLDSSLLCAVLFIVRCLSASLTHMPLDASDTPTLVMKTKCFQISCNVFLGRGNWERKQNYL